MTRLRKMMLDELERRNYSQNTRRLYLHAVSECAQYFHCSPDQLGLDHIRDYQARLFRERKLKPNSVCAYVEALRFFFMMKAESCAWKRSGWWRNFPLQVRLSSWQIPS